MGKEIKRLEAENEELKRKFGFTYCAYCGEETSADAPNLTEHITHHIRFCEKHPIRILEDALRRILLKRSFFGCQFCTVTVDAGGTPNHDTGCIISIAETALESLSHKAKG